MAEEKTYTQAEFDAHMAGLRRTEDEKHAALKTKITELEGKTANVQSTEQKLADATTRMQTLESAAATAEQSNAALKEVHAGLLKDIPESNRSLISDKLSIVDQVNYILTHKSRLYETPGVAASSPPPYLNMPPAPAHQQQQGSVTIPGGYRSMSEFVVRDPRGYADFIRTHPGLK